MFYVFHGGVVRIANTPDVIFLSRKTAPIVPAKHVTLPAILIELMKVSALRADFLMG